MFTCKLFTDKKYKQQTSAAVLADSGQCSDPDTVGTEHVRHPAVRGTFKETGTSETGQQGLRCWHLG